MSLNRVNDDGTSTSIPLDPANADYRAYLAGSGRTHEEVLAEAKTASDTAEVVRTQDRDRQRVVLRSARKKLIDLGLTRAEFRALFPDPDPE